MAPEEFRSIRLRLGFTQAALAEKIGVSKQQVKRYEANPKANMHRRISPVLANLMRLLNDQDTQNSP